jgi:hypothetical protein
MTAQVKDFVRVCQSIVPRLAETLAGMGGHLECNRCRRVQPLGDVGAKLSGGWPLCHRQTMTWVTARQLAERKAKARSDRRDRA